MPGQTARGSSHKWGRTHKIDPWLTNTGPVCAGPGFFGAMHGSYYGREGLVLYPW